ncbi:hypothetical protein [Streptomyces sp. MST-110588]|uniref:hypothetical protein n=1 Tax=Streptomyces sp. MST-110588 TaxID=2833628 RepID=UPI001F5DCF7A|nr:hypothetical protein [Streptomyces sp. MST-110588]UNO39150.1 hypothetical protein KGS77_05285 [Streptomyces sp. MST-110588]
MQFSAGQDLPYGQDLPHTRTRAVHWLVTAAALAAVVAGSSFLRPADATATSRGSAPGEAAPAPGPQAVTYPIDCGPNRPDVVRRASGDLDGDGRPETVAVVRCHTEAGTPPSGIYVLARAAARGSAVRIVATLLAPSDKRGVEGFGLERPEGDGRPADGAAAIRATLVGYSSADVPQCCPDVRDSVKWRWREGEFVRSAVTPGVATQRA